MDDRGRLIRSNTCQQKCRYAKSAPARDQLHVLGLLYSSYNYAMLDTIRHNKANVILHPAIDHRAVMLCYVRLHCYIYCIYDIYYYIYYYIYYIIYYIIYIPPRNHKSTILILILNPNPHPNPHLIHILIHISSSSIFILLS
jgi:hypothetical protein